MNFKVVSYLDHAVTIGVGDVRLQTSKQGSVVMLEIKVLQSKFGVFNRDLIKHGRSLLHISVIRTYFHTQQQQTNYYKIQIKHYFI